MKRITVAMTALLAPLLFASPAHADDRIDRQVIVKSVSTCVDAGRGGDATGDVVQPGDVVKVLEEGWYVYRVEGETVGDPCWIEFSSVTDALPERANLDPKSWTDEYVVVSSSGGFGVGAMFATVSAKVRSFPDNAADSFTELADGTRLRAAPWVMTAGSIAGSTAYRAVILEDGRTGWMEVEALVAPDRYVEPEDRDEPDDADGTDTSVDPEPAESTETTWVDGARGWWDEKAEEREATSRQGKLLDCLDGKSLWQKLRESFGAEDACAAYRPISERASDTALSWWDKAKDKRSEVADHTRLWFGGGLAALTGLFILTALMPGRRLLGGLGAAAPAIAPVLALLSAATLPSSGVVPALIALVVGGGAGAAIMSRSLVAAAEAGFRWDRMAVPAAGAVVVGALAGVLLGAVTVGVAVAALTVTVALVKVSKTKTGLASHTAPTPDEPVTATTSTFLD